MWPFKCKHPAESLGVHKAETRKQTDEDFDVVTYHLSCHKCGKVIEIKYAAMRGGVSAFLERGKQEPSNMELRDAEQASPAERPSPTRGWAPQVGDAKCVTAAN